VFLTIILKENVCFLTVLNMKKFGILFGFYSVLIACTSNTIYKKPANLIPKDQMVNLLTDMQLAVFAKGRKNKNLQRKVDYMHLVYKKYGVDSLRFQKSNLYYTSRIDDYTKILKKVHANLLALQKELKATKKINDSLLRLKKGVKKTKLKSVKKQ